VRRADHEVVTARTGPRQLPRQVTAEAQADVGAGRRADVVGERAVAVDECGGADFLARFAGNADLELRKRGLDDGGEAGCRSAARNPMVPDPRLLSAQILGIPGVETPRPIWHQRGTSAIVRRGEERILTRNWASLLYVGRMGRPGAAGRFRDAESAAPESMRVNSPA